MMNTAVHHNDGEPDSPSPFHHSNHFRFVPLARTLAWSRIEIIFEKIDIHVQAIAVYYKAQQNNA